MKKIVILSVTLLLVVVMINGFGSACTVFNASNNDIVLVGRNMDWTTSNNFVAFLPSEEGKYGRVYFGWGDYPSWYQGGMNEEGLVFAYLAAPYLRITESMLKPRYYGNYGNLMEKCMEECSTVEEVLEIFDMYNLQFLERCQVMVVDQSGDSAIIEGDNIISKENSYQVVTNFYQLHPELGGHPCWRYNMAIDMLEDMEEMSVDYFSSILYETHQEGSYPTVYSIVYDVNNLALYLYYNHNYSNNIVFNLSEELELGFYWYSIPSLFNSSSPPNKPTKPSGTASGVIRNEYTYFSSSIDSDGDQIYYLFDWGDGTDSGWIGPYGSGETAEISHSWATRGNFEIKVKAKDVNDAESEWSDPLPISMPYDHQTLLELIIEWVLQLFGITTP